MAGFPRIHRVECVETTLRSELNTVSSKDTGYGAGRIRSNGRRVKARKPLTTIVGACLAAVAAGCLVLFSLLAQNATLEVSDGGAGVKVATPEETSPVISLPGRSGSRRDARTEDGRRTDNPITGPLALLVEPLAPGDSLAELAGPGGGSGSISSPAGPANSNGGGGDRVAVAPERLARGPRTTLDTSARAVRTAVLAMRAQDGGTGRPAPGDGGNGRPGKSNGGGGDKGRGHPERGHGAGGNSKNENGKGHGKAAGHASKADKSKGKSETGKAKGKSKAARAHGLKGDAGNGKSRSHGPKNKASKSKAPKTNRSKGGGHRTSSAAPKAAKGRKTHASGHSSGPPAHSKSKAPEKTPPGHAKGGPPGKAKGKKR